MRKRFPCCSALLFVAVGRLRDGDSPTVVVRDLLVAGVQPVGVRKVFNEAGLQAQRSRTDATQLNIFGAVRGLLTGRWRVYESTDKRDPDALQDDALANLDRWEARRRDGG